MSKKSGNKEKFHRPMFFFLRLVVPSPGETADKIIQTAVCIDFNKGVISFSNPETPVTAAENYVRLLPDFFGIRVISIGFDDFDEAVLSHVD